MGDQMNRPARETQTPIVPEVGDLATYRIGSDCYACTVCAVSPTGYRVTIQLRTVICTTGNATKSEQQRWMSSENPDGEQIVTVRRRNGEYFAKGAKYHGALPITFGEAKHYVDPGF